MAGHPCDRPVPLRGGGVECLGCGAGLRLARETGDVARLLAGGLTNRQIGTHLFISERTVDSHVRSIPNKLGFASRAQIAAWVAALDK